MWSCSKVLFTRVVCNIFPGVIWFPFLILQDTLNGMHLQGTQRSLYGSWMRTDRLSEALEEAGYVPGQRLLTPKQVAVIVDHIGEP